MKTILLASSALAMAAGAVSPALAQDTLVDVLVVTSARAPAQTTDVERPDHRPVEGPDATLLMNHVPGGARVGNGALSGQVQYRGLFGARLNLRIDGQHFATGGPNMMDPPFHYAPPALIEALEIDRGVSPVSQGPGLAGGVDAVFRRIGFSDGEGYAGYDLTFQGRSTDESYSAGGVAGYAAEHFRFNLLGSYETGDNTRIPGGEIADTAFERGVFGLSAGARGGAHEGSIDLRRQNTGPSGNPPFAMDIIYFDADIGRLGYVWRGGETKVSANVGYADVTHGMNNFTLRPGPAAPMTRETIADARTRSAEVRLDRPVLGGVLRIGADTERVDRNVLITNPLNALFFIESLPDIDIRRTGGFVEWTGAMGPVAGEVGLRIDSHSARAGTAALGSAVAGGPVMLANAFNAADRTLDNDTVDVVARLWTPPADGLSWRLTLARKTRVPGHVERFSWLPTEASGGLADGNIYVGDLALKPEVAWIAEAGFDLATPRAYVRPTVYVRSIDDYIQGVPIIATTGTPAATQVMVASMNGDATPLVFANVDARLYGADVAAGYDLAGPWRVDAVASYVRGERRDINDALYRVTPASLAVSLTYEKERWSATLESRLVASQSKVSATNSEQPTDGYAIVNLYGDWQVRDGVRLSAGVENLFDERYEDHLAGYNRVAGSEVPVGARLPGSGLGGFVRLSLAR